MFGPSAPLSYPPQLLHKQQRPPCPGSARDGRDTLGIGPALAIWTVYGMAAAESMSPPANNEVFGVVIKFPEDVFGDIDHDDALRHLRRLFYLFHLVQLDPSRSHGGKCGVWQYSNLRQPSGLQYDPSLGLSMCMFFYIHKFSKTYSMISLLSSKGGTGAVKQHGLKPEITTWQPATQIFRMMLYQGFASQAST